MYIYKNHLGGLYIDENYLDYEDLYCEECGDSDWCIGQAETKEEAWELLKDETDINGPGSFEYEYVQNFIDINFEEEQKGV